MADQNKTKVPLVTTGGLPPYTYTALHVDPLTTLPIQPETAQGASVTIDNVNSTIEIDTTTVAPGTYSLNIQSTDSAAQSVTKPISVKVVDSTKFTVLTESMAIIPATFPYVGSVALRYSGANGLVFWSIMPSTTSLAGASIDENGYLNFTVNQYGVFSVGIQARDSFKTITKIINVSIAPQSAYKLVNGQIEVDFRDNGFTEGVHSFSVTVGDSASASVTRAFEYLLQPAVSPIKIPTSATKYWYTSDTNAIYLPITGSVSGLSIQDSSGTFSNGVSYSIEGISSRVKLTGPPTIAENSELEIPIHLQLGNSVVASVSKTFTVPAFSGSADQSTFYEICNTKPTLVGEFFTLNPQKPYFNSPSIERSRAWKARVKQGYTLPTGLSLDEETGLIYGRILDSRVVTSRIEFVDSLNQVKGVVVVNFDILPSAFSLIDESLLPASVSIAYQGLITTTTMADLAAIEVVHGNLPTGLTVAYSRALTTGTITFNNTLSSLTRSSGSWIADGIVVGSVIVTSAFAITGNNKALTVVTVSASIITVKESVASATAVSGVVTAATKGVIQGTPTEAGYFDIWIKITDTTGAYGHIYKRFEVVYITPLAIITPSLPLLTPRLYGFELSAVGGRGGYVWTLAAASPALPTGLSLSEAGVISGTYASNTYSEAVIFVVTDSHGATATKTLTLTFVNTLDISTLVLPQIIKGEYYSFTLRASGGSGTYTGWAVTNGTLPTGITLNPTTGSLEGLVDPSVVVGTTQIEITVTDSVPSTFAKNFSAKVAPAQSSLSIRTSNMGTIKKGGPYHGTLEVVLGDSGASGPFTWEISPSSPNALPAGLTLSTITTTTPSTSGAIALITGNCVLALSNVSVKVRVIDVNGLAASTFILFSSEKSVALSTASLSQGKVGDVYSQTLNGFSYNLPIVFTSSALPATFTLSADGVLAGNPASISSGSITFTLTDSIGDTDIKVLSLVVKNSNLVITTSTITNIPRGLAWSQTLTATGSAGGFIWSVSPNSASKLPDNVQLSSSTGVLSTTGTSELSTRTITFRVTDADGSVTDKALALTVAPTQTVQPGPDYVYGTTHGYLGYIARGDAGITSQISPRVTKSFYAVMTHFNATSLGQITVSTNDANITAVAESMTATEVWINITIASNGYSSALLGDNTFTLNIVDDTSPFPVIMKYKVIERRNIELTQNDGSTFVALPTKTTILNLA